MNMKRRTLLIAAAASVLPLPALPSARALWGAPIASIGGTFLGMSAASIGYGDDELIGNLLIPKWSWQEIEQVIVDGIAEIIASGEDVPARIRRLRELAAA